VADLLADRVVLVTGGAGFIGANLVAALLSRGCRVRILDDLSTGARENLAGLTGYTLEVGSILDPAALRQAVDGCGVVFHMAAEVGNVNSLERPFDDARTNGEGTLAVCLAARAAGVTRLVYSSSAAIFGEPVRLPIDEGHPMRPESYYGVSKLAGERYAWAAGRLGGLQVNALRYFNVYGRGQRYNPYGNVIPIFVARLLTGESPTVYGDGEQTRDFVNVADVVQANLRAATCAATGEVFNVGSGTATSVNQLMALLRERLGGAAAPRPVFAPPRAGEVVHSVADVGHARRVLGYEPRVGLVDGLREFVDWYKEGHTA
jgi:UDP-glucose 4-epimerase